MKKSLKTIGILLAVLTLLLTWTAAGAENAAVYRTLEEIKASGTVRIGVFSDKYPFG